MEDYLQKSVRTRSARTLYIIAHYFRHANVKPAAEAATIPPNRKSTPIMFFSFQMCFIIIIIVYHKLPIT